MKIHCQYSKLVPLDELRTHPKNPNKHPKDQIARLAQILEYQGWRYPIKVSNLSGFITSGHGRLEAARKLGLTEVPVSFQDYQDEAQEYADIVADNTISKWAVLDFSGINLALGELGPDLDIGMLGLQNFFLDPSEKIDPDKEWDGMPEFNQEDKSAYRSLKVNFANDSDVERFSKLVEQKITEKTRGIWYPAAEIGTYADKRYVDKNE